MATLSDIIKDPNFVNANAETKKAIFDKYSSTDRNYSTANEETKAAIKKKYGIESEESINWGRLAATTAGGIAGGLVAAPAAGLAAIPTAGLGGLATEAAGVGLGAGIGGQLYDIGERLFAGPKNEVPLKEQATQAVSDVAENALMVPGARAIGEGFRMAAPYVAPYIRPIIEAIPGTTIKAKRLAQALMNKARDAGENIAYGAEKQRKSAEQASAVAKNKALSSQQEAKNAAEAYAKALAEQERIKASPPQLPPAPKPTNVGQAREATAEIGVPVKAATANEQRNIIAQRAKNDAYLRQARNQIVAENEAAGVQMSDQPAYQAIVKKAEPIANWQRSGVKVPDPSIANTYKELLRRISPQTVELSAGDAAIAAKNGITVRQEGDKFYRDIKPNFESIDNARRFLGEVFSGKAPEGYGAIKGKEQADLYALLSKAEEEFVGKAQPRLQANWRDATTKLNTFNEGIGPKIIGAQPEKVAPMIFSNKGAGSFDDAVAATGSERVARKALSDQLATDMANKNYKSALAVYGRYKQVLQNPKLADLKARVEAHLTKLNDNELAGIQTKNLFEESVQAATAKAKTAKQQVSAAEAKASEQSKLSQAKATEAGKAAAQERSSTNAISEIFAASEKDPEAGADMALAYLKRLADSGKISTDEYRAVLNDYNKIDFKKPAEAREKMKKWVGRVGKAGAVAAGAGGGYYYGLKNVSGNRSYTP